MVSNNYSQHGIKKIAVKRKPQSLCLTAIFLYRLKIIAYLFCFFTYTSTLVTIMKKLIAIILISFSCNAQEKCIENENIGLGGDFNSIDYTFGCPTYSFSFIGDKSKEWNIMNNPIGINQVADEVLPIKSRLENKIKEYTGEKFFSKLEFYSVQISYPDSI